MSELDSLFGAARQQAIPDYNPHVDLEYAAREAGVPVADLAAHAGMESNGGRNMVNPMSSASGPLQVVRGTFDEVNNADFGGGLDWNSNRDKTRAGARYYKKQLDKYGDRGAALAAYFIGPAKADELIAQGGTQALMDYSVPGQGRPIKVRDYVNHITGGKALSTDMGQGSAPAAASPWDLLNTPVDVPPPRGEVTGGDYANAAAITAGDFAKAPVGVLENIAGQVSRGGGAAADTAKSAQEVLSGARKSIAEWQKGFFDSMSPEAVDRAQRELLTLDPQKTIWKGGAKEFMSSMALKGTMSLGPTIGPMVTSALLQKMGVGAAMATMYGATEGLMSAGLTATQIADDIDNTPVDELMKVDRFKQLNDQFGEAEARRQYINEVQGIVPAATGLLVGALAHRVGKRLDTVFGVENGLPAGGRFAAGFATEALQEAPQSYVEQVAQNYAKMAYDSKADLFEGAAEQAVQGALLGGPMGGTFATVFGSRPARPAGPTMSSSPIPEDIRAAVTAQTVEEKPPQPEQPWDPRAQQGAQDMQLPPDEGSLYTEQPQSWDPNQGIPDGKVPTPKLPAERAAAAPPRGPKGQLALAGGEMNEPPQAPFGQQWINEPQYGAPLTLDGGPPAPAPAPQMTEQQDLLPEESGQQSLPMPYEVNQQREPKFSQRPRREQLGYRVRVKNEDGSIASSTLVGDQPSAKTIAKHKEKALGKGQSLELVPARRTFIGEQRPTPEPVGDLLAQTRDLRESPDRQGVYLTRESLDNLRESGHLDEVLAAGVPIENFDTYGGTLLAKDDVAAQELMKFIEAPDSNIDEVLGYATGAGVQKRPGANMVVQKLDEDGNVIRERLVTHTEVGRTKQEFGEMARALPLQNALANRAQRVAKDQADRKKRATEAKTAETAPAALADLFGETKQTEGMVEDVEALARQGGSDEDVGKRLVDYATDVRKEEKGRAAKIDKRIPAPEDVQFRGRDVVEKRREITRKARRAADLRQQRAEAKAAPVDTRGQRLRTRQAKKLLANQEAALAKAPPARVAALTKSVAEARDYVEFTKRGGGTQADRDAQAANLSDAAATIDAEIDSLQKSIAGIGTRPDLLTEYKILYGRLLDAAIRVQITKATGTVAEVDEAEGAYDSLVDDLKTFLDIEGGFTKSEAAALAASRYSPKARKAALDRAAKARTEADEKDIHEPVREEKAIARNEQDTETSVKRMAKRAPRALTKSYGKAQTELVDRLVQWLAPHSVRKLGKESSAAAIEIRQLLQQWLTDYRAALRHNTPADAEDGVRRRNWVIYKNAGLLSETLGKLRSYQEGDVAEADKAAIAISDRISSLVAQGKRYGVGSEMDIDGFWKAAEKGPVVFRDYLRKTVKPRDGLPFPTDLTEESLEQLSLGALNSLFSRAVQYLGARRKTGARIIPKRLGPERKRKYIMRAVRSQLYKRHGGKGKYALSRTPTTKYNTGVLTADTPPRELKGEDLVKYNEDRTNAQQRLADSVSSMDTYLKHIQTKAFEAKTEASESQLAVARAYATWIHEYANALINAHLKSRAGIREMNVVSRDLDAIIAKEPKDFVSEMGDTFKVEEKGQRARVYAANPVHLGELSDPEVRAVRDAEQLKRLSREVAFHDRMEKKWSKDPRFAAAISPVLRKLSVAVERFGYPRLQAPQGEDPRASAAYVVTPDELNHFKSVLEEWRITKDATYAEKGRIWREWGIPANELYTDFYLPLTRMSGVQALLDKEQSLEKAFRARYTKEEAESFGSMPIYPITESGSVGRPVALPIAQTSDEAAQQLRSSYETEDQRRKLAGTDDMDALDLNAGEKARRKQLIGSKVGKAATAQLRLLSANEALVRFRDVVNDDHSSIHDIAGAEAEMIRQLTDMGMVKPTGKGLVTLQLPDATDLINALEDEQRSLSKLTAKVPRIAAEGVATEQFKKESLLDTDVVNKAAESAGRIAEIRAEIDKLRRANLGGSKQTIAYRLVGDRLRQSDLTKEEAREVVRTRLAGFKVAARVAKALNRDDSGIDLNKAQRAYTREYRRRSGMDAAQRRLVESLDRRGLKYDLTDAKEEYGEPTNDERDAFYVMRDMVGRNENGQKLGDLLTMLSTSLAADHHYQPLIKLLSQHEVHRRVPVLFRAMTGGGQLRLVNSTPVITLNIDEYQQFGVSPRKAIHVLLHEATHAATVGTMIQSWRGMVDKLDDLRKIARAELGPEAKDYGLVDVYEFVAEAYTNPQFQEKLRGIKVADVAKKHTSLWDMFVSWVRELLSAAPQMENLLDAVMSLQDETFGPTAYNPEAARAVGRTHNARMEGKTDYTFNYDPHMEKLAKPFIDRFKEQQATAKIHGSSMLLNAMSMRQLQQFYKDSFGGDRGPLNKYMSAFFARNAFASTLLEDADKLSRRWSKLEESNPQAANDVSALMVEATQRGIHPDQRGTALHAQWNALPAEAHQLYNDVRSYYKATQEREVKLMLVNAIRASKLWNGGELTEKDIDLAGAAKGDWLQKFFNVDVAAMKQNLRDDSEEFDEALERGDVTKPDARAKRKALKARANDLENTIEELRLIARMASIPSQVEGPYFPLMRFGDYAVKAERIIETKSFLTRAERREYMDELHQKDPTLQFSWPPNEKDTFSLQVREVEFRLAETITEANKARAEMVADYGDDAVSSVQLKRNVMRDEATISSNRALQTLMGKLEGNSAAQAAVREFYIKSLSDRSFRKREAKRKNVAGVDAAMQHRTFGAYSKSASYYTAQLRHGHEMADAKAEMHKVAEKHRDTIEMSAVRMGQVVREIETRDDQMATLADVNPIVRKAVEAGQLWMLLSPSYWMINATQPYMVTLPWLSGRTSSGKALAALAKAQALIADPLFQQGVKSWAGLKALKSRVAAEEAFSVLENVEAAIRQKLGKSAQPTLDMLTELKRESIIDLSFVAELRDIAQGQGKGTWDKVMDASRVMAHLTEVNNRIMTAIAAYNVGLEQGLSQTDAVDFAKRAVVETQFDYSSANKPRLFSANDAAWKPIVFQFMQYVQHMYVMFFRHFKMLWAPTPAERKVGLRVVLGMLGTHAAAGGLVGASPQLVKWAVGALMALVGAGDDEDRTFKNLASGDYYDGLVADALASLAGNGKTSEVLRAGLPRLAGVDISSRVAFLQSHLVDLDPKTSETLMGSLLLSFGGPMFGLAANFIDAEKLFAEGDSDKAMEKLLPKMGRDAIRANRMWREGMTDYTGKQILSSDKLSPWELFVTSMGFTASQVSEVYERNNRSRAAEDYVGREKARIMAAFRKSGTTGELSTVMADMRDFNKKFPQDRITYSALLRSKRAMERAERNIQRYGVDAGKRSGEYADDDTYNVE